MVLYDDPHQEKILWRVREAGLGATARVPGQRDTWEGWEDSAVAPEKLGDYLRELRRLFQKYGYGCSLYGHFGQGCVHTRIDFDLVTAPGIRKFRAFLYDAADLVVRFGGSFSGEHGDGQARAELLPKMFGPELIEAFRGFWAWSRAARRSSATSWSTSSPRRGRPSPLPAGLPAERAAGARRRPRPPAAALRAGSLPRTLPPEGARPPGWREGGAGEARPGGRIPRLRLLRHGRLVRLRGRRALRDLSRLRRTGAPARCPRRHYGHAPACRWLQLPRADRPGGWAPGSSFGGGSPDGLRGAGGPARGAAG